MPITHYLSALLILFPLCLNGQAKGQERVYTTGEDRSIFERYITAMAPKKTLPMEALIVETATFFLGTPYVASTLEKEPEGLVVNLRGMDCTTFVEYVIALSRTLNDPDPSFDRFCRHLQHLRYREGVISGYAVRLHYMTDWIYENERKGIVKDMAKELGGDLLPLRLDFMSTHPDSYKQLKGDPQLVREMERVERRINGRTCHYLPKAGIAAFTDRIKPGDIVCFTTTIKGLDVTHAGIIMQVGGRLTFIHASTSAGRVAVYGESLKTYLERGKSTSGILIARPLPPGSTH
ncbi:MAG: DUF1460 domain-containing protein [Tannerellaceae bacterium]|jgi:hypothetical protein|nr:DUF1460 domain-containing protein [Tannerellaceae bacterium]